MFKVFVFFLFAAIYLARGNHESDGLNESFGFHREVSYKVGEQCVELFSQAFCFLPLAHLINDQFFVVHGGLFTHDGVNLSKIRDINRFCQPPDEGYFLFMVSYRIFLFTKIFQYLMLKDILHRTNV